jgi:SAM-dependent methyltransferase
MNIGCGPCIVPGWINIDQRPVEGLDVCCDIRKGLAVEPEQVDDVVAIHMLQDLSYPDLLPVLSELRRVLKPNGILRLGLPDLDKSIEAYRRRDPAYFHVPDRDAESLGGKLITQLVWYGSVRTPFTYDFIDEWLRRAGFRDVTRCAFKQTHSVHADIVALDNRERESLFVEAER